MTTRRRITAALASALAFVALAACGGADDDDATVDDRTSTETTDQSGETDSEHTDESSTGESPTDPSDDDRTDGTGGAEESPDAEGPTAGAPTDVPDDDAVPTEPAGPLELSMPLRETVDVEALDELRTEHVGNNSAVLALAAAAGMPEVAEYTVELHTDEEPYGITFHIVDDSVELEMWELLLTMENRGVLLMATIENLDEIYILMEDGESGAYLERSRADEMVGASVAELGADTGGLREIVERLDSNVPEYGVG